VSTPAYPWFQLVSGEELVQGDIVEGCPVYQPPDELAGGESLSPVFDFEDRDVIVMTQTCDLVAGREKVAEVVLCPAWQLTDYKDGFLSTSKGREEVRRGNLPGYHMLAASDLSSAERDVRVIDFRQLFSLPIGYVRKRAGLAGPRLRLLPPYREHLAQAFARFFMRIGLPTDIPPFR
jgi:hypothetical protein